jgi:hypothetical protein
MGKGNRTRPKIRRERVSDFERFKFFPVSQAKRSEKKSIFDFRRILIE